MRVDPSSDPVFRLTLISLLAGVNSVGGGVFPLAYQWNASSTSATGASALSAITAILWAASPSLDTIVVPSSIMPSGASIDFYLTVINRVGGVSTPNAVTVTKSTAPMLTVGFDGGVVSLSSFSPVSLSLTGAVSLPSLSCKPVRCYPVPCPHKGLSLDSLAVTFSWSIQPVGISWTSTQRGELLARTASAQQGRQLIVYENTFSAATDYEATLSATPSGAASVQGGTGKLIIRVGRSPLTAAISGGS
eukprot:5025135-Prymnesium_polylepis.1